MLHARYLNLAGRSVEAKAQLAVAGNMAGDSAITHYNLGPGLLYTPDAADEMTSQEQVGCL